MGEIDQHLVPFVSRLVLISEVVQLNVTSKGSQSDRRKPGAPKSGIISDTPNDTSESWVLVVVERQISTNWQGSRGLAITQRRTDRAEVVVARGREPIAVGVSIYYNVAS